MHYLNNLHQETALIVHCTAIFLHTVTSLYPTSADDFPFHVLSELTTACILQLMVLVSCSYLTAVIRIL